MKTRQIVTLLGAGMLLLTACKKDKTQTDTDPEKLMPETGKVFHYNFNGSLKDGSGNGMDAVDSMNISYTADRFGRSNQAILFYGDSNPTWMLTPSLDAKITGFPFSVSFWFKTSTPNEPQGIIKADGLERAYNSGFWVNVGMRPGQVGFGFGDKTSYDILGTNYIVAPDMITADTWYHIVVNVKGANDYDFYINGVKKTNCETGGSASTIAFYGGTTVGMIGRLNYGYFFNGAMDDYRIYTKALSQSEVSSLYSFHP
jgi:hypothetical protein